MWWLIPYCAFARTCGAPSPHFSTSFLWDICLLTRFTSSWQPSGTQFCQELFLEIFHKWCWGWGCLTSMFLSWVPCTWHRHLTECDMKGLWFLETSLCWTEDYHWPCWQQALIRCLLRVHPKLKIGNLELGNQPMMECLPSPGEKIIYNTLRSHLWTVGWTQMANSDSIPCWHGCREQTLRQRYLKTGPFTL